MLIYEYSISARTTHMFGHKTSEDREDDDGQSSEQEDSGSQSQRGLSQSQPWRGSEDEREADDGAPDDAMKIEGDELTGEVVTVVTVDSSLELR